MVGISSFRIRVIKDNRKEYIKRVHEHYLNTVKLDSSLDSIREEVLDNTEAYINAHRKRAPVPFKTHLIDVLRETSFIEKVDKATYRLSIGDKKTLDEKVSYWYIVNYGGIIGEGKDVWFKGIFTDGKPVPGGSGNTWFEGGIDFEGKTYLMKPKNPIPPMHYISFMAEQFQRAVRKFKMKQKSKK